MAQLTDETAIREHRAELRDLVNEQRQARRLLLSRDAFLRLPYQHRADCPGCGHRWLLAGKRRDRMICISCWDPAAKGIL